MVICHVLRNQTDGNLPCIKAGLTVSFILGNLPCIKAGLTVSFILGNLPCIKEPN